MTTANGTIKAAPTRLAMVDIGGLVVRDVDAIVLPDEALSENLLGRSFLSKLRRFEYATASWCWSSKGATRARNGDRAKDHQVYLFPSPFLLRHSGMVRAPNSDAQSRIGESGDFPMCNGRRNPMISIAPEDAA